MEPETLDGLFLKALDAHRDKIAVIEDSGSSRCDMTYNDLWDTSCIVSEMLDQFSRNYSGRIQFIGVCMEQSLIYPAVILGILSRGFGFACVDPSWSSDKQVDYLRQLRTPILIHTSEDRRCDTAEQQCRVKIRNVPLYFEKLKIDENSSKQCSHRLAYAVLTSGSTGQPKIVRVPHLSVVSNIVSLVKLCEVTSRDVIFLSSPPTFDPSVVDIFLAFATGASLLVTSNAVKTSASSLLNVLFPSQSSVGISILQMTPSVFNRWSEKELKEVVLGSKTSLRVLILGGEPFPSHSKLVRCTGVGNVTRIYNIYGITEVSPWASIHQVIPSTNPESDLDSNENPIPLGDPLPHTIFQIRDCVTGSLALNGCGELFIGSSKRVCEIDNENCLDFSLPVFRGTGDIVQMRSDGRIYYVGRKDLIVKRWGCRINLENVEQIALSHPAVKSACCVWDEVNHKLFLLVTVREVTSNLALRRHFLTSTESEKAHMPDEILQVNDVSLTQHGKINRHIVLELLNKEETPHFQLFVAKKFLKLWCEVLGLQTLQEGSFIHFGGNSLLAMILITELENEFGDVPKDLAGLLLSGKSVQFICEHLCQFYQTKNSNSDTLNQPDLDSSLLSEQSLGVIDKAQGDCKMHSKHMQDKLISFNLPGRSSSSNLTSITVPHKCLKNLQMNLIWKMNLGKCIDSSPLCLEYEREIGIVIGSHSGKFTYIDGTTGEVRWLLNLPHRIEATACPSVCGQYVYVGCHDGALYCITMFDGIVKWSFVTGGIIKCLPVQCNQGKSIIFGSYDSKVYCLNSESGQMEWSTKDDVRGNWLASPLILGDIAVICSLAGWAYAVKTADGSIVWTVAFHQPIFSTPCHFSAPSATFIVIAEVKGAVICLNALNGEKVWSWQAPGLIYAPLTVVPTHVPTSSESADVQGQILVSSQDCYLYCLFVSNRNVFVKWKVNLGASILSVPYPFLIRTSNEIDILCCVASNKAGVVVVIGLHDGSIFSKFLTESEVFSSPVVCKDKVYFGCRDNYVYCLKFQSCE